MKNKKVKSKKEQVTAVNSNSTSNKTTNVKSVSTVKKGQFNKSNTLDMWWYHVTRSKSFDDFISAFNEKGLSLFAAIPMILLIVSPVLQTLWIAMDNDINIMARIYPHRYYILKIFDFIIVPCGLFASVINFLKEKEAKKGNYVKRYLPLVIFVIASVWIVLTSLINGLDQVALTGYGEFTAETSDGTVTKYIRNESMFTYLEYFLVYFASSFLVTNEDIKKFLIRMQVICASIVAVFAVIAVNTEALLTFYPRSDGLGMNFWQLNHYGYYLAITIVCCVCLICFEEENLYKVIAGVLMLLNIYVLIKNNTFGAMLAAVAGILFLAVGLILTNKINRKHVLIALGIGVIAGIVLYMIIPSVHKNINTLFSDIVKILSGQNAASAGTGRWRLWTSLISLFNKYPKTWFIGAGIDRYSAEYQSVGKATRPHNEILEKIYFFGLPFAIMYLSGIVVIYRKAIKKRKTISVMTLTSLAAAFTYFMSSLVGVSMFYSAPFFFTFLGLSWARDDEAPVDNQEK